MLFKKGSFAMPKDNDSPFLLDKHKRGLQNVHKMARYPKNAPVDLLIVGAYPDNSEQRDLRRGNPAEHDEVVRNVSSVRMPATDPVSGANGPLTRFWGA